MIHTSKSIQNYTMREIILPGKFQSYVPAYTLYSLNIY